MSLLFGCEPSPPAPGIPRATAAGKASGERVAIILIGLAFAVGLLLRCGAAQGELWLDELMSLDLVSPLTSLDQVFWNVSHDNNHFLNSLWMVAVGQAQPPLVYRIPSMVFGMAAMIVATGMGWRVSPVAAVAAAWITACSYVFVNYGSEARGYAGLLLAMLVAIDLGRKLVERNARRDHTDDRTDRTLRWQLGVTIALGTCAHLTMIAGAIILGLGAAIRLKQARRSAAAAFATTLDLLRPSMILLTPVVACLGLGVLAKGEFTVGGAVPFALDRFFEGYGGLLNEFLGLRQAGPPWLGVVVTAILLPIAFGLRLLDRRWIALAIAALTLWPAFMVVARVSNVEHARYFLPAGIVLPVFLAEIVGRLWDRGPWPRRGALALMAIVCGGQINDLGMLLIHQRGAPSTVVARMGQDGPTSFIARYPTITEPVIASYAKRLNLTVTPSGQAESCIRPAEWIVWDSDFDEAVPETRDITLPACRRHYAQAAAFPAALWSGRSWTLYRRVP